MFYSYFLHQAIYSESFEINPPFKSSLSGSLCHNFFLNLYPVTNAILCGVQALEHVVPMVAAPGL